MKITTVNLRDNLQELLENVGLMEDTNLLAMHLDEIEDETAIFLDQLTAFRSHARYGEQQAAQEALVELSLSLRHMSDHAQAALPLLDHALGIDEEQSDQS
jgi:hypothetical protein